MRLLVVFAAAWVAGSASADGKFYSDRVPPDIPYQRAFLSWDGNRETLIIESKFQAKEGERFGWVVPVPSLPTLGEPPENLDLTYAYLEARTGPFVIHADVLAVLAPITLFWCYFFYRLWHRVRSKRPMGRVVGWAISLVVVGVLFSVALPSYQGGVRVLHEERAGPYAVQVISGSGGAQLIQWLNQNALRFDEGDRSAFDSYVKRGWVFVVAKLDEGAKGGEKGKLVPPLMLTFASKAAVYPLLLTGTARQSVEVLLYVQAPTRMAADAALPLKYAGQMPARRWAAPDLELPDRVFLTKFRGIVTPAQMVSDLELKPAASNLPHREWEFRW